MPTYQVIKRPLILTEKGNRIREAQNTYLFEVDRRANKVEIKNAVETQFSVTVTGVNTSIMRGKLRGAARGLELKTQNWKKAFVSVKAGDKIEFFEGA